MQVLAFLGSPRKNGNSEMLLQAVLRGVEQGGGRVIETVRLCDLRINPCLGCGGCDKTGQCVQKDDMLPLYEKILAADRVILASPIYFYGITAQAKAFVDRTQALWSRKQLLIKQGVWQDNPERKGFLVSVAATRGARVFEGAVLTMRYAFDAMGMEYGGDFLVKSVDRRGEIATHGEELVDAEAAGRALVQEVCPHVD